MRLIDADALIECLEQEKQRFKGEMYSVAICMIENTIKRQPTAYDLKKVVEDLKEKVSWLHMATKYGNADAEQQEFSYSTMMMYEVADLVDDLIDIVKKGGVE